MKGACTLLASVVAASTFAVSSSSSTSGNPGFSSHPFTVQGKSMNPQAASLEKGKFGPKFDGLRFIETLITAHSVIYRL